MSTPASDTTPVRRESAKRQKIAVLGGGAAAMATVFRLTNKPNWQLHYDITVYQLGWRLGGKGASGRNQDPHYAQRIEEHGVHIFFGFYNNAFNLMQATYAELDRAPDALLSTWDKAFKGHRNIVLEEKMPDGSWFHWDFEPPTRAGLPGTSEPEPSLSAYIEALLDIIESVYDLFVFPGENHTVSDQRSTFMRVLDWFKQVFQPDAKISASSKQKVSKIPLEQSRRLSQHLDSASQQADQHDGLIDLLSETKSRLLDLVDDIAIPWGEDDDRADIETNWRAPDDGHAAPGEPEGISRPVIGAIAYSTRIALKLVWRVFESKIVAPKDYDDKRLRLGWIILNYAYAHLNGAYQDDLFNAGIESINDQDYRHWVTRHGINDGGIMRDSALIRWLYDAIFAYRGGDCDKPSFEAGTGFQTMVKLLFTYEGDFTYKMQAGMGDVVFAPIYEVLRRRGVKFEFFHRVELLEVDADKRVISGIQMERQATTRNGGEYDPLIDVQDRAGSLPCWPAEPLYEQLQDADTLRQWAASNRCSLEYTDRPSPLAAPVHLTLGRDFDQVVLGISLGGLHKICEQLVQTPGSDWGAMLDRVGTVRTQAYQLWLNKPLAELVGDKDSPITSPAVLCAYDYNKDPIDSYADMHQVLARETWAETPNAPRDIAYFCCFMRDLPSDHTEQPFDSGAEVVKQNALTMLNRHMHHIWPAVCSPALDWQILVDPREPAASGEARFDAQFWISISNPSDRYVATFTDTSRYRIWPHRTGFDNLYVAGDWARNTFNLGCAESAVMSGLAAANAINGDPIDSNIPGWGLFCAERG